ncbi:unnamed protein product [Rotaria socialis]
MYIVIFISETLQFFACPIDNNRKKVEASSSEQTNCSSTSPSSGEINVSTDKALQKCMYNAYEGAALSLPQLPKLFFFITNKSTCCEWLNRFRIPIILTALRTGQYESAARNSNQYLLHTCSLGQAEVSEFEFVIISFVQSLIKLHNSMTIHGIYVWLKNIHQLDWSWIQACEHEAAGNLEQAAYEYKLFLYEHFKSRSIINEKKQDKISAGLVKENRDFEGLKVSVRKMPNPQATVEALGRSISCSWDMKAFDMLATVETLKRVSKRRSTLWPFNAVLQLTQDLTRIHNVDEHASWSEE